MIVSLGIPAARRIRRSSPGLILAALRQIPQQMRSLQAIGRLASGISCGKTSGIHGYGRIGRTVAGYGKAFGMNVLVWAGSVAGQAQADGYDVAPSRNAFYEQSDVVSLHMRLGRPASVTADLSRMKPTAPLVNTSRAHLIAPGASWALREGGPDGRGDVYEDEPLRDANPLLAMDNGLHAAHRVCHQDEYEIQFSDVFQIGTPQDARSTVNPVSAVADAPRAQSPEPCDSA